MLEIKCQNSYDYEGSDTEGKVSLTNENYIIEEFNKISQNNILPLTYDKK